MKIAYAATYDSQDISQWSGTPYYMTKAFEQAGVPVTHLGPLAEQVPALVRMRKFWKKLSFGHRESIRFNVAAAQYYAEQLERKLAPLDVQAIIASQVNPIAYLDCKQPIILWTDALYASLLGFYPPSANVSANTILTANQITRDCLSRCQLAIFSSDWATEDAIRLYGVDKKKVKVVPYGANLPSPPTLADVRRFIQARSPQTIKLLFIGTSWHRKGGDIAFSVAKNLHAHGQAVELHLVGCHPPDIKALPSYIKYHGFISKKTPAGMATFSQLLSESHFLIVPSTAEAFGIVFAEANAFGVPALTTYVGGISTVVKDDRNGKTFSLLNSSPQDYCNYIINLMQDYSRYEELALSSFHEYETRLNWKTAIEQVKELIRTTS